MTPLEEAKIRGIARALRSAIFNGDYRPGDQLPTRAKMAKDNKVSAETIGNVMRMLAGEGLVRLEQGRGSYVQPVSRYEVTVVVPLGHRVEVEMRARAERRVRVQEDDDPALGESTVNPDNGSLRITMPVAAADSGRAAALVMTVSPVARALKMPAGTLTGASPAARPA